MPELTSEKRFRPNVAVVVLNSAGLLLACHRTDVTGAWQLPQGGIDPGETPEQAMIRELQEEIGTAEVSIIGRLPDPIRYDWPPDLHSRGHHGQEQYYFLVELADETLIDFNSRGEERAEFDKYEWLTASQFRERISGFKSEAYKTALQLLEQTFPGHIAQ